MEVEAYLRRIGVDGAPSRDAATLAALQRAHLRSVPFEALDCYRGVPIRLEHAALYDKVVERGRGGFCFELNGLFSWLLTELGFEVTLLAARPVSSLDGSVAPERAHLTLLVDEVWLTDVGFGHFTALEPVRLDDDGPQVRDGLTYRIVEGAGGHELTMDEIGLPVSAGYRFTLESRALGDFQERCNEYATAPGSPFVTSAVFTRVEPGRRVTVTRTRVILSEDGTHTQEQIDGDDAWREALFRLHGVRP